MGPIIAIGAGLAAGLAVVGAALGIGRIGRDTQVHRGQILLVRVQQLAGELGGLTETQRQQTRRQWIEGSRVPGLFGTKQTTGGLQRMIGRNAEALV